MLQVLTVQINYTMLSIIANACSSNALVLEAKECNTPSPEDDQSLLYWFFKFFISDMAHSAVAQVDWSIAMDIAWLKPS